MTPLSVFHPGGLVNNSPTEDPILSTFWPSCTFNPSFSPCLLNYPRTYFDLLDIEEWGDSERGNVRMLEHFCDPWCTRFRIDPSFVGIILRRSERWGSVTMIKAQFYPSFNLQLHTFSMSCYSVIIGLSTTRYIVSLFSISTFFLLFEETSPGQTPCTHNRHEPRTAWTANSAFSAGWISFLVDPTAAHHLTLEVGYLYLLPSAPLAALRARPICLSPCK